MALFVDTATDHFETDENVSPIGKRKSDTPSGRCSKRSPLSEMSSQNEFAPTNESGPSKRNVSTPAKPCIAAKKTVVHSSSSTFRTRVSKEEVEATDEGRASVDKLSAWLASESAKKAKKPPTIVPVNPVRFRMKPKINREDVEATDDKRVSVKQLTAWISDDPFEQKKLRHIRSGVHVINKSRAFEPDKPPPYSKKVDIKVGSVHEKQAWLSGAFKHEEDGRPRLNKDKAPTVRPYQNKAKPVESPDITLKSVNEKKEWLSNAFKKNDETIKPIKSFDSVCDEPKILNCLSADNVQKDDPFPCIGQRMSYDGTSDTGSRSPVRLYKKSEVDVDSPKESLKTVHDKQQWLSNAFKAHPAQKATRKETSVAKPVKPTADDSPSVTTRVEIKPKTVPLTTSKPMETTSNASTDEETDSQENQPTMSVADRAKWLRGAFSK